MKRFFLLSRPFAAEMLLGLFLTCFTWFCGLGLGAVSGAFLTATALAGLSGVQGFNVFLPSAAIRFFSISRTAGRWFERVVTHDATFRVLGRLRVWLFGKLSGLAPRQVAGLHAADVLNRLTSDIDRLDRVYLSLLVPTTGAVITLGILAGLLGTEAFVLSVPLLVLLVLAAAGLPALALRGSPLSRAIVDDRRRLRVALLDVLDGLDDLDLHKASWERARGRVAAADAERLDHELRFQRLGAFLRALLVLLIGLAVWAVIGLAAAYPEASVPGPILVGIVMLAMGTSEVLQGLPHAWLEFAGTLAASRRVSSLAEQPPSLAFAASGDEADSLRPLPSVELVVKNLSFSYFKEQPVLQNLSFEVPAGAHAAILGPSGGGKSTLAALLAGLEAAPPACITWGGREPASFDEVSFRRLVSAATQEPWMLTATIADNLRLASREASDAELFEVLDLVGLGEKVRSWPEGLKTWIEEGAASLSGGERRRLAVARALLRRCPVTILDEPTEGLDDVAAEALVEAVRGALRGKTLIWISHRPHGISSFDKVLVLGAADYSP